MFDGIIAKLVGNSILELRSQVRKKSLNHGFVVVQNTPVSLIGVKTSQMIGLVTVRHVHDDMDIAAISLQQCWHEALPTVKQKVSMTKYK